MENTIALQDAIVVSVLTLACLVFLGYFLFFDKPSPEDVEIDNIYRRIQDNKKMTKQIDKDLESATTKYEPIHNESIENNS